MPTNLRYLSALMLMMPMAVWADVEAIRQCRKLTDAANRLACYDKVPLPDREHASRIVAPETGASVPVASTGTAPGVAAPAIATARFGLENRAPATAPLDAVRGRIAGPFDGWEVNGRIRLANGQVWQVVDGSTAAYDLLDPEVEITRGSLGSYFMKIAGVSQTPRVRRIE